MMSTVMRTMTSMREHEEDMGFLSNSDFENTSMRFGLSKTGDWGYVGVSINQAESVYGIPYHGEHMETSMETSTAMKSTRARIMMNTKVRIMMSTRDMTSMRVRESSQRLTLMS